MRSLSRGILVGSVLLLLFVAAEAAQITPNDCGRCHLRQFSQWFDSLHRQHNVDCNACHGELHSASMVGCRETCHPGKHDRLFRDWAAVQRLDPPDSQDYVCTVCHHPHRGQLQESKQACTVCHNPSSHASTVELHTGLLESMYPTENDGYAMLAAQSRPLAKLAWMHDGARGSPAKRLGGRLLIGVESVVVFFGASLLLFPLMLALLLASGPRQASRSPRDERSAAARR
jgi:hypothetical protein